MNYYEVKSPYYALMKAENLKKAKEKYIKYVADDDGSLDNEIVEVGRDYALAKFTKAAIEHKKLIPITQVLEDFYCAQFEVLIVDGSLA